MHIIQSRYRDVDIEIVLDSNRTLIGVDSGGEVIASNEVTLYHLMEIVVLPMCDNVRYQQWLFMNRPIEPRDNGVSEVYSDGKQAYYVCNRCGVSAPHTGCVECD
jgi:hypothetical protein